ncbi:MAG: hypothetical protein FWB96_05895 [Defluviitaleaceae bacterium]|nr:hypothetical protein [Defluviitaleaceae bacterium]MCL2262297.1 hypothetical protein [Defluviitaleaceae bacterium]
MNAKKQRREAAQKKAKKRKITIVAVCAALFVMCIAAAVIYAVTRPDSRVFAVAGGQSVTLYENGRFVARLFHNMDISGSFIEDGNSISFAHDGMTSETEIENDVLILPVLWRATCRVHSHEIEFPLVN